MRRARVPDALTGWRGREWEKDAGVAFGAAYNGEDGIAWGENMMPAFSAGTLLFLTFASFLSTLQEG